MLAALHMASVAAMVEINPLVSIRPRASPLPLRPAPFRFAIVIPLEKECSIVRLDAGRRHLLAGQRQDGTEVFVRSRNDLNADDFADARRRRAAGVDSGLDRCYVTD